MLAVVVHEHRGNRIPSRKSRLHSILGVIRPLLDLVVFLNSFCVAEVRLCEYMISIEK